MKDAKGKLSCSDCGVYNCYRLLGDYPQFCPTPNLDRNLIEDINDKYRYDPEVSLIARAAAEIEGRFYGKLTRVEEIIEFAHCIGAEKVGVATCVGLINEAKVFMKILKAKGLSGHCVVCKVGAEDKRSIGIPEDLKLQKGYHESLCNPILQAELLNQEGCGLNVIIGLCVGHDALFMKHSKAPVTTLIVKDRVLGHNPAAALYTSGSYYKRVLEPED
ncbi:DUF1847 domain-containing protein [Heliobacterium undosum]|uniref:DUF1847 domain-containing protein n=1 Tax=Heliomicrobium undosum TaxID=121734 RepID=A0A845L3Y6_9FIRM|nr:DUF1847 domain-containing protein [Heliomicrobium undosum]MZP31352.1 DUF1847 domain-containing protein [Heliomicrobium undosum]